MNREETEKYRKEHRLCPKCGCTNHSQTLAAICGDRDDNRSTCHSCGWRGIVHDLVAVRPPNACNCNDCIKKVIDGEFEQ